MPIYGYKCQEHGEFEQLFKTHEAADKNANAYKCPDCGSDSPRIPIPSSFSSAGTQHSDIEKAVGMQARSVDIGGRMRPGYMDVNGKFHEIKDSGDIKRWQKSNRLGPPVMTEWINPITKIRSWVPKRARMIAGADGEPLETLDNPILRESEDLIDMGSGSDYVIPSASRTGEPIDPKTGTTRRPDANKVRIGGPGQQILDPVTGKPLTLGDCWGNGGAEVGYGGGQGYMFGRRK